VTHSLKATGVTPSSAFLAISEFIWRSVIRVCSAGFEVCFDMQVVPLRNGNAALEQIVQGAQGFIPVLDVAAERFLEELDYGLEANNASRFEKDMASVEVVRGAVKVPHVFRGLSGRCVLTQEWVDVGLSVQVESSRPVA
jgi:hypothetical protein